MRATQLGADVNIRWIDSETITRENVAEILTDCDGIIVPGGFGDRGIEGMIAAADYCPGVPRALLRHLPGYADQRSSTLPGMCCRHGRRQLRRI